MPFGGKGLEIRVEHFCFNFNNICIMVLFIHIINKWVLSDVENSIFLYQITLRVGKMFKDTSSFLQMWGFYSFLSFIKSPIGSAG